MTNKSPSSRRRFLGGMGASMLLAPFVPSTVGRADGAAPKRFIVFWTPNGLYEPEWTPSDSFEFGRILAPLEPFKDRILAFKNVDWQSYFADPSNPANDHTPPLSHSLCATSVVDYTPSNGNGDGDAWGGGPSIDQFIGQRISADNAFRSLVLTANNINARRRLSYRAARDYVPAISDPARAFEQVFRGVGMPDDTLQRVRAERQSVIDVVRDELRAFSSRVGTDDQRKIDAHLEHLRSVERRITSSVGARACVPPNLEVHASEPEFVRHGRQHLDILTQAVACDLTRVGFMEFDGANTTHEWAGVNEGHHTLSHYQSSLSHDATNESLTRIGTWYAEQFLYLLQSLDSIDEGDCTALDNTVVLWTSEQRALHGDHGRRDVPFLIAGGGGYFETGRKFDAQGASHNDLFVSICHAMGMADVETFGNPAVCTGPML